MSDKNDWETPAALFAQLNEEFCFTLDPCASDLNHKCYRFFTIEDDGLKQSWGDKYEVAFVNPPYNECAAWMKKCYEESLNGVVVVALIPVRSDTRYWHQYVMRAGEIRLIKGRVKFVGGKSNAPFPSAIVVWDRCDPKFNSEQPNLYSMEQEIIEKI